MCYDSSYPFYNPGNWGLRKNYYYLSVVIKMSLHCLKFNLYFQIKVYLWLNYKGFQVLQFWLSFNNLLEVIFLLRATLLGNDCSSLYEWFITRTVLPNSESWKYLETYWFRNLHETCMCYYYLLDNGQVLPKQSWKKLKILEGLPYISQAILWTQSDKSNMLLSPKQTCGPIEQSPQRIRISKGI